MTTRAAVLLIALLFAASGCGGGHTETGPPLPPASGQVLTRDGKPLEAGLIQLISQENKTISVNGRIQNGAFSLVTLTDKTRQEGTPAGTYQVTIMPGDLSQQPQAGEKPPQPVTLKDHVTITVEGSTTLEFKLP